jgi:hypothetical protein
MSEKYKVLCIGVDNPPVKEMLPLNYAEKDAYRVAKHFQALKKQADVTLMIGKNATRTNIIQWLEQCNKIQEPSIVVLYFSGHGTAVNNNPGKLIERCLWLNSSQHDNSGDCYIKTAEILQLLKNPFHKLIFVIDACYSQMHGPQELEIEEIFQKFKESERIVSFKQYVIISASAVNMEVYEDRELEGGVLTHYFLKAISGKYSFFTSKQIPILKLIHNIDVNVRNHKFTVTRGRKKYNYQLMYNGIMVHHSAGNFRLPILEPTPLIIDPGQSPFQQKISRLIHFFTCTRVRSKISLMGCMVIIFVLLTFLAHKSMVRLHFDPGESEKYTIFHNTLFGDRSFVLDEIDGEKFGKKNNRKEFNLYLFKHNWFNILPGKLDSDGKIILMGNLLGDKITGVDEKQVMEFAIRNSDDIFYWHRHDVETLLKTIRKEYRNSSNLNKKRTLNLLAKLGKKGKTLAKEIFDFKGETDQELRNLFLKHFYSPEKGSESLKKTDRYLNSKARDTPSSGIPITTARVLEDVYDQLRVLKDSFYTFLKTNLRFWSEETIQRVLTSPIPHKYIDGLPLLEICKQLPDIYRKEMLFKIFAADIEDVFRQQVEIALVEYYPREFLELFFRKGRNNWKRSAERQVVKAYRSFSYETLKDELISNLREGGYWKVYFISKALINKELNQQLNINDIRHILDAFTGPSERILLRKLRNYLNRCYFN